GWLGEARCSAERRLKHQEVEDHEQPARPGNSKYPGVEAREQPLHLRVVARLGDAIDRAAAVGVHHNGDEDEDDERGPQPCGAPERPHETEHDPGYECQSEKDPAQRAGGLRYLEQLADSEVVTLLLEVERNGHRMDEQEPEHARDMDEHDRPIHQTPPVREVRRAPTSAMISRSRSVSSSAPERTARRSHVDPVTDPQLSSWLNS